MKTLYGKREPARKTVIPDDTAVVLDFLPQGNPFDKHPEHKRVPVAQVVGDKYFTLFELVVPEGEHFEIGEKIYVGQDYIGKGPIKSISGPIEYNDLTTVAKENLPNILAQIIKENERTFVKIFNLAGSITLKMHVLELFPSIGKRTLNVILEERKRKPFETFEEMEQRLSLRGVKLHSIEKIIAEKIIKEMKGEERYYLFIKPKPEEEEAVFLKLLNELYKQV